MDVAARRDPQAHVGVRIDVTAEQQHLEKEHAHRPHRGAPPEPRKDHLGDKGLHLEEQEGAQENHDGVEDHEEQGEGEEGRRVASENRPMLRSICRTL